MSEAAGIEFQCPDMCRGGIRAQLLCGPDETPMAVRLEHPRRSGMIPFEAIRDDGVVEARPDGFAGPRSFWSAVRSAADDYRRHRQQGQPRHVEVWCEAAGMVPQLARVSRPYGVPVFSSGGFDSTTAKYSAAKRILRRDVPTVVLSVGDLDPSGTAMFDAAEEDVAAFVSDLDGTPPAFIRAAVTREQVDFHGLPEKPANPRDRREGWEGGTV